MSLCPDFDISNILLKDFDIDPTTQVIPTNVSIGNTTTNTSGAFHSG